MTTPVGPLPAAEIVRETTPVALSYVPIAVLFGTLAHYVGLSALQTAGMSLFVYSGAAQLAAIQMLAAGASHVAILFAAAALAVRHILMGAALSVYTSGLGAKQRSLLFPLMTDESFALAWRAYRTRRDAHGYFLGANVYLYLVWNAATLAGYAVGAQAPILLEIGLEMILPLLFVAIIVGLITTRVEAVVTVLTLGLLFGARSHIGVEWLIPLGGLAAASLGMLLERGHASSQSKEGH